jgi:hypothetical protein
MRTGSRAHFGPFFVSLGPLSPKQPNHGHFGTDVESSRIQRVGGRLKGVGFEKPPLRRSEQGSNCPVRRGRYSVASAALPSATDMAAKWPRRQYLTLSRHSGVGQRDSKAYLLSLAIAYGRGLVATRPRRCCSSNRSWRPNPSRAIDNSRQHGRTGCRIYLNRQSYGWLPVGADPYTLYCPHLNHGAEASALLPR